MGLGEDFRQDLLPELTRCPGNSDGQGEAQEQKAWPCLSPHLLGP